VKLASSSARDAAVNVTSGLLDMTSEKARIDAAATWCP
jgi:hypothetical protein